MISYRLRYTLVAELDKWMGSDKHKYWHWSHCNLPHGRCHLSELKLSHPDVIPIRGRMAAPLRLASWIRFETVMDQKDWLTAIELLVPKIFLPDPELLELLRRCVPEQGVSSMAEAQACQETASPTSPLCRGHCSHDNDTEPSEEDPQVETITSMSEGDKAQEGATDAIPVSPAAIEAARATRQGAQTEGERAEETESGTTDEVIDIDVCEETTPAQASSTSVEARGSSPPYPPKTANNRTSTSC